MHIALIGAVLSDADFLILDEPSNHLDRPNRQALIEQLQRWPNGLLVVSHKKSLLAAVLVTAPEESAFGVYRTNGARRSARSP